MQFGQLIVHIIYNKINNFLENSHTRCGEETSPRHFFENSKLNISLDQQFEIL